MKNSIKIIIIFEIATSFFSAYPMNHKIVKLGGGGNFFNENFFVREKIYSGWRNIFADSLLYTNSGLPLISTAVACGNELFKIRNAVSEGRMSLTSDFVVRLEFTLRKKIFENIFAIEKNFDYEFDKKQWMEAAFQGYDDREKNHFRMCNALTVGAKNVLKIELPDVLSSLMVSFLPECCISGEEKEFIKEAKQKLDKEEQSPSRIQHKLGLKKENSYLGKITDYVGKNPKRIVLMLVSVPILFYFLKHLCR